MNQQPGRELDKQVAEVMGTIPPLDSMFAIKPYSTRVDMAMEAWEWLEKNNPWNESLIMGRLHRQQGFDPFVGRYGLDDIIAWGETYPHAICLAVLASREIVNEPNK